MKTLPTLGEFCEIVAPHIDSVVAAKIWFILAAATQKSIEKQKQDQHDMPYITTTRVEVDQKYNIHYGDDRECECGHSYYRHFDTYADMENIGCKYCHCFEFKEKK